MDDPQDGALETTSASRFVDWQNCYRTARDAFGFAGSGIDGNVKPALLCGALARDRQGVKGELVEGRIYSGRASQERDPKTYAANRRQFSAWVAADPRLRVIARTLDYKLGHPREKGIDVQLAIDIVRTSLFEDDPHDIAIVVSADTDLLPALELVVKRRGVESIEVATWSGRFWAPKPLSVVGHEIRQHQMSKTFYDRIADDRDYNVDTRSRPPRRYK